MEDATGLIIIVCLAVIAVAVFPVFDDIADQAGTPEAKKIAENSKRSFSVSVSVILAGVLVIGGVWGFSSWSKGSW